MSRKKELLDLYVLPTFGEKKVENVNEANTIYPKKSKVKKNVTYYLSIDVIEQVERMAYWDRLNKGEAVEKILNEFFAKKTYEPIPNRE
ncbi:MAG: hypothetical protein NZ516_10315 [Raineya sp.]|nr:hypothetical protein [Raineya sp.]